MVVTFGQNWRLQAEDPVEWHDRRLLYCAPSNSIVAVNVSSLDLLQKPHRDVAGTGRCNRRDSMFPEARTALGFPRVTARLCWENAAADCERGIAILRAFALYQRSLHLTVVLPSLHAVIAGFIPIGANLS